MSDSHETFPVDEGEERRLMDGWLQGFASLPGSEDFGDASDQVAHRPLPYYAEGSGELEAPK